MTSLNDHAALLNAIMKTAVDTIVVIDSEGIIQQVNPAIEKQFGYQAEEVIGENVSILMASSDQGMHGQYLKKYFESGQGKIIGSGREVIGKRKDESTFSIHLAVSEVHLDDQVFFTGVIRDITALKEAEQKLKVLNTELEDRIQERTGELRDAQAEILSQEKLVLLGQVSAGIAHEIRNPLNVIQTSTYFLRNAKQLSAIKKQEHLERIDRQVGKISDVVTALVDVACLPDPKHVACSMHLILKEAIQAVSLSSSVRINNVVPSDLPFVMVDASQIAIVFRNIIQNADDAMPNGGVVTLSSERSDSMVLIHIADTGEGMKPEEIDRVMEPFYSTKARGMGLGLAISNSIVQKNLGFLSVSSRRNEGAIFSISLPIAS